MSTSKRNLKTMDDVPLDGKRVLVRVDLNVTVGDDGVIDQYEDYRLEAAVPTIQELQQRRCKILLLTHRGRPDEGEGEATSDLDLMPVARRLQELLRDEVRRLKQLSGSGVEAVLTGMEPGGVALLPNVRLDEREAGRSDKFATELASAADVYVNEAFSVSHRNHTSVALIPTLLPSCAGRRTVLEYKVLRQLRESPEHPYIAIVSGNKVHTKMTLLRELLHRVDKLCLGGRLGNVVLAALGKGVAERYEPEDIAAARHLLREGASQLVLPVDVVVGPESGDGDDVRVVSLESALTDSFEGIWDIGPDTVKHFLSVCSSAKTIMWNGPVGRFEVPAYSTGTRLFAEGLASFSALRVVGGGDTVHALELYKLTNRFDHVSVGGGAMVTMLEGGKMPGLEPLFV